jgi:hypothetical protein
MRTRTVAREWWLLLTGRGEDVVAGCRETASGVEALGSIDATCR